MFTWEDVYYPGQIFKARYDASVKPSLDNCETLKEKGCHRLGLKSGTNRSINLVHLLSSLSLRIGKKRMPYGKVVVIQYPSQYRIEQIFNTAKGRGNKIVLLAHDIDELRNTTNNAPGNMLGRADIVIVHTPRMKEWMQLHYPDVKCEILGLFDYRGDQKLKSPEENAEKDERRREIIFAGNLNKAAFIKEISGLPENINYLIYGPNPPEGGMLPKGVVYKGTVTPDQLPYEISSADFGLVWDGSSADSCKGDYGNYLRYNIPYKASSYIASGLPLILWDQMGLADFVVKEGIGITVGSLNEIPARLSQMSDTEYQEMKERVLAMKERVSNGEFFTSAIQKALDTLNEE